MPTQRQHGGAPLVPINIVAPGVSGLNSIAEATILGQEWATILNNAIFDGSGRVAVRKGWATGTTAPVAGTVQRIFEFTKADNSSETIFSTDTDIFTGTGVPTSIEGTLAIAEGNIKFVNFNDKCIALGTSASFRFSLRMFCFVLQIILLKNLLSTLRISLVPCSRPYFVFCHCYC